MNNDLYMKIVRSDGIEFVIDEIDWGLNSISGHDSVQITNQVSSYANTDGTNNYQAHVSGTPILFSATAINSLPQNLNRKIVQSFFRPKYEYKMYLTIQGATRWCDCRLDILSCPLITLDTPIEFTVQLLKGRYEPNDTPDTFYWKHLDRFGQDIASVENKWGYPMYFPEDIGTPFDIFNFANGVELINEGDTDATLMFVITSTGNVVNPKIMNDNFYVEINDTLVSGDVYILDFITNTITKNGEDAIGKMNRTSNFSEMKIPVGQRTITYSATQGENDISVTVYYDQLYNGVHL